MNRCFIRFFLKSFSSVSIQSSPPVAADGGSGMLLSAGGERISDRQLWIRPVKLAIYKTVFPQFHAVTHQAEVTGIFSHCFTSFFNLLVQSFHMLGKHLSAIPSINQQCMVTRWIYSSTVHTLQFWCICSKLKYFYCIYRMLLLYYILKLRLFDIFQVEGYPTKYLLCK